LNPPKLSQSLVSLSKDPSNEIREIAHSALFSESCFENSMSPRYIENLFLVNELECFEIITLTDQPITARAFSLDHTTLAFATEDDLVFCGDTK
jgi:hypothetical protein